MPVVSGVIRPGPDKVIERIAAERRSPLFRRGIEFVYRRGAPPAEVVAVETKHFQIEFAPHLYGEHQAANAAVAVATLDVLAECGIRASMMDIQRGLESVEWPARFEMVETKPLAILDCAHNVASAEALARTLNERYAGRPRSLIFAASSDKDIGGMFHVLAPQVAKVYMVILAAMIPDDRTPADLLSWVTWDEHGYPLPPDTVLVLHQGGRKPGPAPKPPGELAPCGTATAAKRHYANGERPCEPCRAAANADQAAKRQAARAEVAA